ncbi:hypothetical protein [Rubrobacter indicoceani]|uniref:hypothetical protein n=1 Tax=Rubrobacter indicoceani TaxID=2051957 RepID=UPI000E5A52B1|nr:hypothetical protein [Rubrobacter indicoceani]
MASGIYKRIFGGARAAPEKLVERGSFRGRSRYSHTLVRVHDHIRYFLFLEGPELHPGTRRDLRRAQDAIERSLGCIPLPPEGIGPSDAAAGHLASAKALCDEYLPDRLPRREAAVKRLVRRVFLRQARNPRLPEGHPRR